MILVKKSCKEAGKEVGVRFPDSTIEALNQKVLDMVQRASERCKENGRVTLKPYDF